MPIADASQFVQFKRQAANSLTYTDTKKHSGITYDPITGMTGVSLNTFLSTVVGKNKGPAIPFIKRDYAPRPAKYAKIGGFGC
jgi:hypothetical protein